MRVRVDFFAEKIPVLYRHRFVALIKETLEKDPQLKNLFYPPENLKFSKKAKPFTFSVIFPKKYEIKKEKFKIDIFQEVEENVYYFNEKNFISLYLSTNDYAFFVNFYNGLFDIKEFPIMENAKIRVKNIFLLPEKKIFENKANFKTNSPVLIEDLNQEPIIPDEQNVNKFNENLNAIQDRIFKDLRGEGLKEELKFHPLKIKKRVVKHTFEGFREKTKKPYMCLTCFEGSFSLQGHPEDLNLIYQTGIGLRRGQGFGMVEVL